MTRTALGALLTMLAMLCFASMDAISKWLVADYAVGQMMWIRSGLFFLFAWFVVRTRGLRAALRSQRPGLQIVRSLVAIVEGAAFVLAFRYLPLADTHAVAATSPLIVIALGVLFLGERVEPRALARRRRGLRRRAADRAAGLPHHRMAAAAAARRRPAVGGLSAADAAQRPLRYARHQPGVVGAGRPSSPPASSARSTWTWPTPAAWALMTVISLIGAVAHYALIKALDYAEAGAVQPYSYTLLVWATLLGWLVFGDVPDNWTILGAAIVVASGLYTWHHDRVSKCSHAHSDRGPEGPRSGGS